MSGDQAPEDAAAAAAIEQLPAAYRLAFHLREGGAPTDFIAEQLGIEPEAVGPLLTLATSKLRSLRHPPPQAPSPTD
jgi:DNA-directed RNA polymerase specialized sigma24 family protein